MSLKVALKRILCVKEASARVVNLDQPTMRYRNVLTVEVNYKAIIRDLVFSEANNTAPRTAGR